MHPLSPTSSPTFTSDSDLHLPWRWVPQLPRYCLLCSSASNPLAWSDSSSLRILLWLWQSSAQKPSRAPLCCRRVYLLPHGNQTSQLETFQLPSWGLASPLPCCPLTFAATISSSYKKTGTTQVRCLCMMSPYSASSSKSCSRLASLYSSSQLSCNPAYGISWIYLKHYYLLEI